MTGSWVRALALAVLVAGCLGDAGRVGDDVARTELNDPVCAATIRGIPLETASVADLQQAMSAGILSAVELVEAYTSRVEALDDAEPLKINSVILLNPKAREQAAELDAERAAGHVRGPLHGIPILLKDNIGTRDVATSAGSQALARNIPKEDSTMVARLKDAGAIILGKTNLREFALGITPNQPLGYSSNGGLTVNAYTGGSPGGSSGGSGVAASMSFATVAMGTDTTGSVIYPSVMNGRAGLRPSHALVSRAGVIPLLTHMDVAGPMGRNVADVAAVLGAIAGPDSADPFTSTSQGRVAPGNDYVSALRPDALKGARLGYERQDTDPAFALVREQLATLGAILVPIDSLSDYADNGELGVVPSALNEFKYALNSYLATEAGPDSDAHSLAEIIAYNDAHPDKVPYGQEYLIAAEATPGSRPLSDATVNPQMVVEKAAAQEVFAKDELDAVIGVSTGMPTYKYFGAAAGFPNMVVPVGFNGKNPRGLNFVGQEFAEQQVLAFAYAYEQSTHARQTPGAINPDLLSAVCAAEPSTPSGEGWGERVASESRP